jgi:hypothetical protein
MQGIPPEDPEGYLPFHPNSPEGSLEREVNNEVASKVGSSHSLEGFIIVLDSLEEFRLPPNPLMSIRKDTHFLWMNSLEEIVVVDNIEAPTGPNARSGVDDTIFQSESFRTPNHTPGVFNPSSTPSSVRDIFGALGKSSNQPMASQMPKTSITYMVPLDHFTGMTSNVTIGLD